jgi:hypothetical protein
MSSFIVLNGSEEKVGQAHPGILGPFADHDTAVAYLNSPQIAMWEKVQRGLFGGWPTALIVSDQTCEDPVRWMNGWYEEEADEEEFSAEGYVAGIAAGDRAVILERPDRR